PDGNASVFKPSELTPTSTILFVDIANHILPEGVLNLVLGDSTTGKALVAHPAIRMISLTGDVSTGKAVAESGARTLKRIGLELGGKAPVLVFADSPIRETARDLGEF